MKKIVSIIFLMLIISVSGLAIDGVLNGTYEKIKNNQYQITFYLPTSHYNINVIEINHSIENSMTTNVVKFTVNQNDLQILQKSLTISCDSDIEYRVILSQKGSESDMNLEFFISFLFGGIILIILFKLLTKKFTNEPLLP